MNREERKRLERGIQKLLKADGDNCTVCRRDFAHGDKTFYGRSAGRRPAVTGECCADQLNLSLGMGLYIDRAYDVFMGGGSGRATPQSPEELSRMVDGLQAFVGETDSMAADVARRAGLPSKSAAVYVKDTNWKADDAAWFADHADRSHRLRPLLPGEFEAMPTGRPMPEMPDNHELQVLVRQVAPGQRIRTLFGRNRAMPIPDEEPVIHALFDIMSARSAERDSVISVEELAALARRYASVPPAS